MPLVTIHPSGNRWRTFEFDACVCTTTVADMLAESLKSEFKQGTITEFYVRKPFIAIKFTRELPSCWGIRVIEAAQAYVKATHMEYDEALLHIVRGS